MPQRDAVREVAFKPGRRAADEIAMTNRLDVLEEQAEKLKNAVKALTSFSRSPQERLDTALSYFVRTFRDPPEGDATAPYDAIYAAIGNPPVGTTIHVRQDTLAADELETVSASLVELCDAIARQCVVTRQQLASAEPPPADDYAIAEGVLESLVPSRGADR
jgi:hypothetical protein